MKRVLSTQHQARVEIESLAGGHDLSETLTRARFEEVRSASVLKEGESTCSFVVVRRTRCLELQPACLVVVDGDAVCWLSPKLRRDVKEGRPQH